MERRLALLEEEIKLQREIIFRMVRHGKWVGIYMAATTVALMAIWLKVFQ